VLAARTPHWFPSVTKQGVSAIFQTRGNETCHVILRGGTRTGPNHGPDHVRDVSDRLRAKDLPEMVMIDCSHGNSEKDYRRQSEVAASISQQVGAGSWRIFGAMLESHSSKAGRTMSRDGQQCTARASLTPACHWTRRSRFSSSWQRPSRRGVRSTESASRFFMFLQPTITT
jgi:3-deoxy-7-phosphoheptulonate synthase